MNAGLPEEFDEWTEVRKSILDEIVTGFNMSCAVFVGVVLMAVICRILGRRWGHAAAMELRDAHNMSDRALSGIKLLKTTVFFVFDCEYRFSIDQLYIC